MTIQIVNLGKAILLDSSDWKAIHGYHWNVDKLGYAVTTKKYKAYKMHRLILGLNDSKVHVDHINHNRSDNRRSNIRPCSNAENQRNKRPTGETQYLGVTYQNCSYKSVKTGETLHYRYLKAKIRVNDKLIHLGTFTDEIEAAKAYNEAAKIHFGEFANLNKV